MTRRVALLGKPLRRRHSQVMHDAAFAAAGIDARYELLELEPDEVEAAVDGGARPRLARASGSRRRTSASWRACATRSSTDATPIGAVNNVVRTDDGRLVGFNTDAPGFRAGVELAMGRPLAGADVVVAGAGGAAHAVVYACLAAGAARRRRSATARRPPPAARGALRGHRDGHRRRPSALDDPAFARRPAHGGPRGQRDDGRACSSRG